MKVPVAVERAAQAALDRKKATDVVILDLRRAAAFTDYFLLVSGTNQKQIVAIADAVLDTLRQEQLRPNHVEGYPRRNGSCWTTAPSSCTSSRRARAPSTTWSGSGAVPRAWRWPGERRGSSPPRPWSRASPAMREILAIAARLARSQEPRAPRGRERNGQGPAGPPAPLRWPATGRALHQGPLSFDPRGPPGVRSSSATSAARSPTPSARRSARSRWRRAAPSTSTRSRSYSSALRPSSSAWSRRSASSGWAGRGPSRSTCASSPPPASALRQAVEAGTFREDLYPSAERRAPATPATAQRREDILPLADLFLARERERKTTRAAVGFEAGAADLLRGYPWPGNVRELRATVERAALLTTAERVAGGALPGHLLEQPRPCGRGATGGRP